MDYPIPRHLRPYLKLDREESDEYCAEGDICCTCGCAEFALWENNGRQVVRLVCAQCGNDFVLFDSGHHGWDGFVCESDYNDRTLPFEQYRCPTCGEERFAVRVSISSQGKEDFLEECVAHDDAFTEDDWVDAFEWITVGVTCSTCDAGEDDWLDLETM